jgi:hypothetical protein
MEECRLRHFSLRRLALGSQSRRETLFDAESEGDGPVKHCCCWRFGVGVGAVSQVGSGKRDGGHLKGKAKDQGTHKLVSTPASAGWLRLATQGFVRK